MKYTSPITPSDISKTSECLHFYYLECFGDPKLKREFSAGEKLRLEQGQDFEKEVVSKIPNLTRTPWVYPEWKQGYEATMQLLKQGPEWIYQGVLLSRGLLGIPDLLKRIERPSKLGDYAYMPIDIKGHKAVTSEDRLQLFSYAYLLEPILGFRPDTGGIWLNTGNVEDIPLDGEIEKEFFDYLDKMQKIQNGMISTEPVRCSACDACLWFDYCTDIWEKSNHVCLLPGVGFSMTKKLKSVGVTTYHELAKGNPISLSAKIKAKVSSVERLVAAAKARAENRPLLLKEPSFPDETLPVYFYDVETDGDFVYLHGVIRVFKGQREEKFFFTESEAGGKKAWHDFLDFLARDRDAMIYSWTMYERSYAKSCWEGYGGNPNGYRLIEERLTDQCAFVKEHFALPCRGYSIKKVAPVFGFNWSAEDAGGMNCESWYLEWKQSKDEALYRKIIEYNLDDVRAMEVIHKGLKSFCEKNGLK